VGGRPTFGNGAGADVFRETVAEQRRNGTPALLVVEFRLRAVHRRAHRLFERESILNTETENLVGTAPQDCDAWWRVS